MSVIVHVAMAFRRSVSEVAHESYAKTLYTYFHLGQVREYETFETRLLMHELAALMSFAANEPESLPELREKYLMRFRAPLSDLQRAARNDRLRQTLLAHQRLVPIDPPSDARD